MKQLAKIENGKIVYWNPKEYAEFIAKMEGKEIDVEMNKHLETLTAQQRKALHLWYRLLAEALNDAGYSDLRKIVKDDFEIPVTEKNIKENIWRPIQKAYLHKLSTTELSKDKEIDQIFEIVSKGIGEKTGVYVPFPTNIPPEYY